MRLDELKFRTGMRFTDLELVDGTVARVWKGFGGAYTIARWHRHHPSRTEAWKGIDALTAQAVLFELCSPTLCRPVDPS